MPEPIVTFLAVTTAGVVIDMLLNPEPTANVKLIEVEGQPDSIDTTVERHETNVNISISNFVSNNNVSLPLGEPLWIFDGNFWLNGELYTFPTPSPQIPVRQLPNVPDNQTPYQTPIGQSIDIKTSLQGRTYGKLIHKPVTNKPYIIPKFKTTNENRRTTEQIEQDTTRFIEWIYTEERGTFPDQKPEFWNTWALYSSENLKGFSGKQGMWFGMKALDNLAEVYSIQSNIAVRPINGLVPTKIEVKEFQSNIEREYLSNDSTMQLMSLCRVQKIFRILGGKFWQDDEVSIPLDELWKDRYKDLLVKDKNDKPTHLKVSNLLEYGGYYLALLYFGMGFEKFPAELPRTLLGVIDDQDTIEVEGVVDYLDWIVDQMDILIGEWPVKIQIDDVDPYTEGDQPETVEIPNIAECLAESYRLNRESTVNSTIIINALVRMATELTGVKNGVVVTQDYAKANAQFLGYSGNPKPRKVNYSFNLEDPNDLEGILSNASSKVQGWVNVDKTTLMDYQQRLMYAAGIIKAVFTRNKNQVSEAVEGIENMANKGVFSDEEIWKEFLRKLEDPNSYINKNSIPKPKVKQK